MKSSLWLLLTISLMPLATIGYDRLESTPFYDWLTGTTKLYAALDTLYSSDPGAQHGLFVESVATPYFDSATTAPYFLAFSKLVKPKEDRSSDLVPTFIMRMAVKNAQYVDVPSSLDGTSRYIVDTGTTRLLLGLDFSPALLGLCPRLPIESIDFPMCKMRDIGNRYELENKIEERKKRIRMNVNVVLAFLGISIVMLDRRSRRRTNRVGRR